MLDHNGNEVEDCQEREEGRWEIKADDGVTDRQAAIPISSMPFLRLCLLFMIEEGSSSILVQQSLLRFKPILVL